MSHTFLQRTVYHRWAILSLVSAVPIAAAISCATSERQRYRQEVATTSAPALHAVHSERLRQVMDDMDLITNEHLPQDFDASRTRDQRYRDVAKLADRLADTAREIPEALNGIKLNEENKQTFCTLAEALRQHALDLADNARNQNESAADANLKQIEATCNACHSAFREAGPLNSNR
jgi:cytochrome c556